MSLQSLITSQRAGQLALILCRIAPPRFGLWLADYLADQLARSKMSPNVQATRSNLWVASGKQLDAAGLDQWTGECWRTVTRSNYRLFHNYSRPGGLLKYVDFGPQVLDIIERSKEGRHGLVVCGVHMGGFDLVVQAAARQGLKAGVLTLPEADDAIEWQHGFRRRAGLEMLPGTIANLKNAIQRLREGQTILTGIDRPMLTLKYKLNFFGYPAALPTHHVTLALRANVPVVVLAPVMLPLEKTGGICYYVIASEPIPMQANSDRTKEIVCNGERVLEVASALILRAPQQWAVFHPLWPQVIEEMP